VSVPGHELKRIEKETNTFLQLCKETDSVAVISYSAHNRSLAKQQLTEFRGKDDCESEPGIVVDVSNKRWLKYRLPFGTSARTFFQVLPSGQPPLVENIERLVQGALRLGPADDGVSLEISSELPKKQIWSLVDAFIRERVRFVSVGLLEKRKLLDISDIRDSLVDNPLVTCTVKSRDKALIVGPVQVMEEALTKVEGWSQQRSLKLQITDVEPQWKLGKG
jgi:hypothetical protein